MENIEEFPSSQSEDVLQSPVISKKRKRLSVSPILRQKRIHQSPTIEDVFSQGSSEPRNASPILSMNSSIRPIVDVSSQSSPESRNRSPILSMNSSVRPDASSISPADSDSTELCETSEISSQESAFTIRSQTTNVLLIEENKSDDEDLPEAAEHLDISDVDEFSTSCRADTSEWITQNSAKFFSSIYTTPEKNPVRNKSLTESTRKKKLQISNGLSQSLAKLINRQASDFRLWRHQQKTGAESLESNEPLCLSIGRIDCSTEHITAHCQLLSGNLNQGTVFLLLASERWGKCGLKTGDTLLVHEPWQSMAMEGGTLVLAVNFMRRKSCDAMRCDLTGILRP